MPKKIGGLIICATLSSAANAVILGNIDLDTYNDDYDYTMTKFATNLSIPSNYDCDESFSNLFNKYGDTDESYCKVETTDGLKFYCFGFSYTGASSEATLPECANIYCNDPSEYAVWERTGAAQGQKFYGCAKYFPGSNCWTDSNIYRNINPNERPDVFTETGRAVRPVECLMPTGRERPYTNGNCPHTQYKSEFIECACLQDDYLYSGSGIPNENGQITISCRSCPSQATCNGSTFRCNNKYYTSPQGNSCTACPIPPSGSGWTWSDLCSTPNPTPNASCGGGATSIQGCFIQGYYYEYADNSGTFELINNCYYTP